MKSESTYLEISDLKKEKCISDALWSIFGNTRTMPTIAASKSISTPSE
jgi:hypothetical protein